MKLSNFTVFQQFPAIFHDLLPFFVFSCLRAFVNSVSSPDPFPGPLTSPPPPSATSSTHETTPPRRAAPARRGHCPDAVRSRRDLHAAQRPHRGGPRGPLESAGGRQRLVSRRVRARGGRSPRLRASLRAHDVPGIRQRGRRPALRDRAGRRRHPQRLHQHRPHQLFRDGALELPGTDALARGRSHGLAARRPDPAEARQPARRGEERAPAELREPPVRPGLDPRQ